MEPRISLVTLGVSDLAASTAFYREGLRLPYLVKQSNEQIAFFEVNRGSLWLALFPADHLAQDAGMTAPTLPGPGDFRGFTLAHNLRSPDEVDAAYAQALAAGATAVKTPHAVFWGGYSGYFADRDGFLWELAHNPFSWIE